MTKLPAFLISAFFAILGVAICDIALSFLIDNAMTVIVLSGLVSIAQGWIANFMYRELRGN